LANIRGEIALAINGLRLIRFALSAQVRRDDVIAISEVLGDGTPTRRETRPVMNEKYIGFAALTPF